MTPEITATERRRLAEVAGVNEQYLYQCLTGRRDMGPAEARRCEEVTKGELNPLHRWTLCQKTWHLIWPELLDVEGHPPPFASAAEATAADRGDPIIADAVR